MDRKDRAKVARRDFLRALGAGAAGVATAAATSTSASAQGMSPVSDDKRKALYRETEHIKTYYRVNRYPAKR